MTNQELGARPEVDEVRAAIIHVVDEEHATMRAPEAPDHSAHFLAGMRRRERGETLRRQGVVPECSAPGLEPRVLRPEGACPLLEELAHPSSFGREVQVRPRRPRPTRWRP